MIRNTIFILSLIIGSTSCSNGPLSFLNPAGPWEKYAGKLQSSDLDKTPMGQLWLQKGESVLSNALITTVPVNFKAAFTADKVDALAWKFAVKNGEVLHINLNWNSPDSSLIFIDLFKKNKDKAVLSSSSAEDNLSYEVKSDDTLILRLQPQLLAKGFFTIKLEKGAVYSVFPVYGKESKDVWSVWGDPRDGGVRKHEGVDIFAPRGTPVVSPASGIVSSVRNGGLGGKSVFVRDNKRSQSLYFAHLDSQMVRSGQIIKMGDTIGTVGNTGNAKYTKPHLHFGIYAGRAIDPFPFINTSRKTAEPAGELPEEEYFTVKGSKANFRSGPGTSFKIISELKKGDPLKAVSLTKDWFVMETPDAKRGYLHHSLLQNVVEKEVSIDDDTWLYWDPFSEIKDSVLLNELKLSSIGTYKGYTLYKTPQGIELWKKP